jgi:hypothetical protein
LRRGFIGRLGGHGIEWHRFNGGIGFLKSIWVSVFPIGLALSRFVHGKHAAAPSRAEFFHMARMLAMLE